MSKHYCEEFGGSLVTIKGPKDQENVYQMIQSGITASANSVINILLFRYLNILFLWYLLKVGSIFIFLIRMFGSGLKTINGWLTTLTHP